LTTKTYHLLTRKPQEYSWQRNKNNTPCERFHKGRHSAGGAALLISAMTDATEGDPRKQYEKLKPTQGSVKDANFAQIGYNPSERFSDDGVKNYSDLARRPINTIDDLANALKDGTLTPDQVSVDYVM
jgi:hypothetical protein